MRSAPPKWPIIACGVLLAGGAGSWAQSTQAPHVVVENVRAFARLYGYVRWFHPSDEAAAVDWSRFAIHGVRGVSGARSPSELGDTLEELFRPIAPMIRVYPAGARPILPSLQPPDTSGLHVVAWQHHGVGLQKGSQYQSARVNRPPPMRDPVGRILASRDAAGLEGRELRFSASVRYRGADADGEFELVLGSGTAQAEPSRDGRRVSVTTRIPEGSTALAMGAVLTGLGKGELTDIRLEALQNGDWTPVAVPKIEHTSPDRDLPEGWTVESRWSSWPTQMTTGAHTVEVRDDPVDGRRWLSIAMEEKPLYDPFFPSYPTVGEVTETGLGSGLRAWVPLALYSDANGTLGGERIGDSRALESALSGIDLARTSASDVSVRLADVIITWNVFQHFYPYFDVVDVDWDAVLTETLLSALRDRGAQGFLRTLNRMLARLDDGHAEAFHPLLREQRGLPIRVDWIEGRMVVVASEHPEIRVGDLVLALDGEPVERWLTGAMGDFSGSQRWKRQRALTHPFRGFARGEAGSTAALELLRDGRTLLLQVRREADAIPSEPRPTDFAEVDDGVFYINLARATFTEIEAHLGALADARGVIFDVRGYPRDRRILSHLADRTIPGFQGLVPWRIYPDRERIVGWDDRFRWQLAPRTPRIRGQVVFLANAEAISFAESILSIVDASGLGRIVGEATAGANGTVNPFSLPGGFLVSWTGQKVLKPDGRQLHLVGVQPTDPVNRSIEAVRAGRDEYLETALRIIRSAMGTDR